MNKIEIGHVVNHTLLHFKMSPIQAPIRSSGLTFMRVIESTASYKERFA